MGRGAEPGLGHPDHRDAERGVRMRAQAGPAARVQIGVAVDDQPAQPAQILQDRAQRREFAQVLAERTAIVARVSPYRPGEFYLRELPSLRTVLEDLSGLGLLVVDGYADLDPDGRPGLGARAHAEFGIPVIGVAKSRFRTAIHAVPVVRGSSARPLFVTSAGMPADDAADLVRRMAGRHRLPDALRRADTFARTGPPIATMIQRQPRLTRTDTRNAADE